MKYIYNILIVLLITVVYSNSIDFGFTLDDDFFIKNNHYVTKGFNGIYDILTKAPYGEYEEGSNHLQTYRPVSHILFSCIYQFVGATPLYYHVVNIFCFIIFGLLLFGFLSKVLFFKINSIHSFFITLIFITHPLNVESVANIKGIDDVLAGIFILFMLFTGIKYVQNQRIVYLILSVFSFLIATLSKESALISPLLLIIISFYLNRKIEKPILYKSILSFLFIGASWFFYKSSLNSILITETNYFYLNNDLILYSFPQRLLIAFYIQFKYIQLLLLPDKLTYDYSFGYIQSVKYLYFIGISTLLVLSALFYLMINKKIKDEILLGLLIYSILIFPVSNLFFLIGVPMAERLTFLPKIGLIIVFYFLFSNLLSSLTKSNYIKYVKVFMVSVFTIFYTSKSYSRVTDWKNNFTLTHSSVNKDSSVRNKITYLVLLSNLSEIELSYLKINRQHDYITYSKSIIENFKIIPKDQVDYHTLGVANYFLNNPNEALRNFSKVTNKNYKTLLIEAECYVKLEDVDKSLKIYNQILKLENFDEALVYNNIGLLYFRKKEYDKSIKHLLICASYNSGFDKIDLKLALSYAGALEYENALSYYEVGLLKYPDDAQALNNYYHISLHLRKEKEMKKFFNQLLEENPNNTQIRKLLSL